MSGHPSFKNEQTHKYALDKYHNNGPARKVGASINLISPNSFIKSQNGRCSEFALWYVNFIIKMRLTVIQAGRLEKRKLNVWVDPETKWSHREIWPNTIKKGCE